MNDDLEQLLKLLHLRKIAEILDDQIAKADREHLPLEKLFARLLRAEWEHRQESALSWRIKQARMPEQWTLESFPFKKQPGVDQRQIRTFAELGFVAKAENIVFIGGTDPMTLCTSSLSLRLCS
jgi:DNA replication protein DnaC